MFHLPIPISLNENQTGKVWQSNFSGSGTSVGEVSGNGVIIRHPSPVAEGLPINRESKPKSFTATERFQQRPATAIFQRLNKERCDCATACIAKVAEGIKGDEGQELLRPGNAPA
jgi:hypothetical protein